MAYSVQATIWINHCLLLEHSSNGHKYEPDTIQIRRIWMWISVVVNNNNNNNISAAHNYGSQWINSKTVGESI